MARSRSQDGGWGWVIVCGSFLNHFLFEGMIRSYGLIYQVLQNKFSAGAATTAWIQASFNAIAMATGPFVGILIEHTTCRILVVTGGLLYCASLLISAHAPNIYFLFFSYSFIGGCGGGLVYSPMILVLSEYFSEKRGKAMGLAAVGGAVGTASVPLLVGYLLRVFGYSACMTILAAVTLHHCIAGFLYRPLPERVVILERNYICGQSIFGSREIYDRRTQSLAEDYDFQKSSLNTTIHNSQQSLDRNIWLDASNGYLKVPIESYSQPKTPIDHGQNLSFDMRKEAQHNAAIQTKLQEDNHQTSPSSAEKIRVFKNISFLLFCFNLFNIPTTIISTFIFLPGLGNEIGISDTKSAVLVSIIGAGSGLGRVVFGFLFDVRLINRHRRLFHSFLGVLLGLATASMGLCRNFLSMAMVALGIGLSEGGVMAQKATALSQYVSPQQLAFAFGILTMFQGFGNLLGPLLQGYLKDRLGTYTVCFFYGGAVTFLSSALLIVEYLIKRRTLLVPNAADNDSFLSQ